MKKSFAWSIRAATITTVMLALFSCSYRGVKKSETGEEAVILVGDDPIFVKEPDSTQKDDTLRRVEVRLSRDPAAHNTGTLYVLIKNLATRHVIYRSGTVDITRLASGDASSMNSTLVYATPTIPINYGVTYRIEIHRQQLNDYQDQNVYWLASSNNQNPLRCSGLTERYTGIERRNCTTSFTFETRNGRAARQWPIDQTATEYDTKIQLSTFGDTETHEYLFAWQEFIPQRPLLE